MQPQGIDVKQTRSMHSVNVTVSATEGRTVDSFMTPRVQLVQG